MLLLGGLDVPLLAAAASPDQAATPFPADGLPALGRTHADVLDDQGRELGTARLVWHASLEADVLSWRGQFQADVRFEILEQVASFSPFTGVLFPAGAESVMITAVGFETNRGNCYRYVATTRAEPPLVGLAGVRRVSVERVGLERARDGREVGLELVARAEGPSPAR